MIKKLLTIIALGSFAVVNAQTAKSVSPVSFNATSQTMTAGKTASVGCGQITTQTTTSVTINTSSPCNTVTNAFGGYVSGSNCWLDEEKANYFAASTYSAVTSPSVSSVAFGLIKLGNLGTSGTIHTVTMSIYGGSLASGPTGAAIATQTALLSQIVAAQTSTTNAFFTYTFTLTTPVTIPATGFYAAITTPTVAGDTIVVANQSAASVNLGWEKASDHNWYDMNADWGATYHANLAMYPTICGNIVSGISKNAGISKNITIMPNPSTGLVNIALTLGQSENINVTVTNALGQQVLSNKYDGISNETLSLDLTSQSNGVYFVTISNGSDKMVQRLILNK